MSFIPPLAQIPQFDLVTERTESGRSARSNACCVVVLEFEFTCWVIVPSGDFLRHFSVRSMLTSVHSVSNSGF